MIFGTVQSGVNLEAGNGALEFEASAQTQSITFTFEGDEIEVRVIDSISFAIMDGLGLIQGTLMMEGAEMQGKGLQVVITPSPAPVNKQVGSILFLSFAVRLLAPDRFQVYRHG